MTPFSRDVPPRRRVAVDRRRDGEMLLGFIALAGTPARLVETGEQCSPPCATTAATFTAGGHTAVVS